MWKRAFILLLSLNLLVVAAAGLWLDSMPRANEPPVIQQPPGKAATVQVALGDNAINTYLSYALGEQKDLRRVLSYAQVQFGNQWDVRLGVKLSDRVVPFDLVFAPQISDGDLLLHVQGATMGDVHIPTSLLMLIFRHLPWPNWITADDAHALLALHFTARPQRPYGIRMMDYSPQTKLLTMNITILPKSLLSQTQH